MARSILIVDCTEKAYNAKTAPMQALGGIERCVLNLADALARKGFDISVWNNTPEACIAGGVHWYPRNTQNLPRTDIVIVCNDPRLIDTYARTAGHKTFLPVVWHHNPVLFKKYYLKGRILPLLRWKPISVFLGQDHNARSLQKLPLRERAIIPHGIDAQILAAGAMESPGVRKPVALFISQAYRGLQDLTALWKQTIHAAFPDAELHIYAGKCAPEDCGENIHSMGRVPREGLIAAMREARVCLIPGHPDETFCLAAAECAVMGVPVVTYGTGALKERVQDGINGYIATSRDDFAAKTLQCLNDEGPWNQRLSTTQGNTYRSWDQIANIWLDLFRCHGISP